MKKALIVAAFGLFASTANAGTISFGDLMYTDLFKWQGQYGTPTWKEILRFYDCSSQITYFFWHVPEPPPVVPPPYVPPPYVPPPYVPPPIVCTDCNPPPCLDCGPPPPAVVTPELSTWAMFAIGLVVMSGFYFRKAKVNE